MNYLLYLMIMMFMTFVNSSTNSNVNSTIDKVSNHSNKILIGSIEFSIDMSTGKQYYRVFASPNFFENKCHLYGYALVEIFNQCEQEVLIEYVSRSTPPEYNMLESLKDLPKEKIGKTKTF